MAPLLLAALTPACGLSLRLLLLLLPADTWSQLWKGAEVRVTLIEKQLAAVYHALLATEPITRTAPTKVVTTYPIMGWVRDGTQRPQSSMAQTPALAKWGANLQQHNTLSTSSLNGELQRLLWPVTYTSGKQEELAFEPLVAESPYQEGLVPIPEDACYIDGSSCGQPLRWRAVAFHPKTETIWMEDGEGRAVNGLSCGLCGL